ncbi:MAG TPA: prolyl oligopeptidase family serine peptidase [Phycisphaerae bacterium]|nr:prolyl oligopeptidase family serine peptidase [Phycisphaerae bacterium]HRY67566.1 prolyl oligopeptidase family serine peptidase [Phycisphaerae bacterium]HSA24953.1 prolyl oligopeptidase family serine peptidase [Phycisphaerae bacterium]
MRSSDWLRNVSYLRACAVLLSCASALIAQQFDLPDAQQPGDKMIQDYLGREAERLDGRFLESVKTVDDWNNALPSLRKQYLYMLGLSPMPERTPLQPVVTGTLDGQGYVVEKLHFQSRPKLYVTANLYCPASAKPGDKLPAVLYVCGHSNAGRDGNKTAYQSHGIWFARHGYLCLTLDTLQLGEIKGIHHGTYREGRWWWHSRGYTPAGVECWNGMRAIDYLASRPEADAERIAVTGISGGGAATFWIAAADPRVKVAVPVSGMADLASYVPNRTVNGHCDCMFCYNTFRWPWTQIAALIAPRPLLFVNSDNDRIFPMDANRRITNRLEQLYSYFGAGDLVDSVVSNGGHAYRKDLRQAAYRFINMHLKGDPAAIGDSEVDLVTEGDGRRVFPIEPAKLRVFPEDKDMPADALNGRIDESFVPMAAVQLPANGQFDAWKEGLLARLREVSFNGLSSTFPEATLVESLPGGWLRMKSEDGVEFRLYGTAKTGPGKRLILVVRNADEAANADPPAWVKDVLPADAVVWLCDPRGVGETRWTTKSPPNYVRRAHVLIGHTVETGQVLDVAAAAGYLRGRAVRSVSVELAGRGAAGVLAAYAALFQPGVVGVTLAAPPLSHMRPDAPQFLNVLRVCDLPESLGMLAPRWLTIVGQEDEDLNRVKAIYATAGAAGKFVLRSR